jgi:hypothetical protein
MNMKIGLVLPLATCAALFCGGVAVAGEEQWFSVGAFDTAVLTPEEGWLRNTAHNDSLFVKELAPAVEACANKILVLDIIAELVAPGATNEVWLSLGDDENQDALRIGCLANGEWVVLTGNQRRNFDDAPAFSTPASAAETNSYRLIISLNTQGGRVKTAAIKTSANDTIPIPAPHLAPPPAAWDGIDPSTWTQARASLRGEGATIRNFAPRWRLPGSLLILR